MGTFPRDRWELTGYLGTSEYLPMLREESDSRSCGTLGYFSSTIYTVCICTIFELNLCTRRGDLYQQTLSRGAVAGTKLQYLSALLGTENPARQKKTLRSYRNGYKSKLKPNSRLVTPRFGNSSSRTVPGTCRHLTARSFDLVARCSLPLSLSGWRAPQSLKRWTQKTKRKDSRTSGRIFR